MARQKCSQIRLYYPLSERKNKTYRLFLRTMAHSLCRRQLCQLLKKNKLTLEELYGVNQKADENTPKVDVENPDEYETSPPSPAPNQ